MPPHRATLTFLILIAALLVAVGSHAHSQANACDTPGFSHAPIYLVGSEPRHATVGDLNGDGKADIVTANYLSDSVSVLPDKVLLPRFNPAIMIFPIVMIGRYAG